MLAAITYTSNVMCADVNEFTQRINKTYMVFWCYAVGSEFGIGT